MASTFDVMRTIRMTERVDLIHEVYYGPIWANKDGSTYVMYRNQLHAVSYCVPSGSWVSASVGVPGMP